MDDDDPAAIHIRVAQPADTGSIGALGRRLSARTRRLRFMAAVAEDSAVSELQREVVPANGLALVAEDAAGRIVGEAFAAPADGPSAEIAFVVADSCQGHGIGTRLLAALVDALLAHGVRRAYAETLAENRLMLEVFRQSGLRSTEERRDGIVRVELELD